MTQIRVMSFNIRCANCDDGEHNWQHRKDLVIDRIRVFQPDLLGLQECREDEQAEFLRSNLPDYHFLGVPRGGEGETALEMAPLMVRRSRFQVLQSGHFWLSPTPQLPGSKGWDAVFARTVTWARVCHRPSGKHLIFANTHFDYQPGAILGAAGMLRRWLENQSGHAPLILSGDFNADKQSAAYQHLTAGGLLFDPMRTPQPGRGDPPTFHGFGRQNDPPAIDWILISAGFQVVSASVDTFQKQNRYPSDHYPILTELNYEG